MRFLKALATDLFASKEEKVAVHVEELIVETRSVVCAIEELGQEYAPEIARRCRTLVIMLPRGEKGFDEAFKLWFNLKEKKSLFRGYAWLASRLIMADFAVTRAGTAGEPSRYAVAVIQDHIEAFFKKHGVAPWKASYDKDRFFEAHRDEGFKELGGVRTS